MRLDIKALEAAYAAATVDKRDKNLIALVIRAYLDAMSKLEANRRGQGI